MRQLDLFNIPDLNKPQEETQAKPVVNQPPFDVSNYTTDTPELASVTLDSSKSASVIAKMTDEPADTTVLLKEDDHLINTNADINIYPKTTEKAPQDEDNANDHEGTTGEDNSAAVNEPVTTEVDKEPAPTNLVENEAIDTIVFEDGKISVKIKGKPRTQTLKAKEEGTPEDVLFPPENSLTVPELVKVEKSKTNQVKFSDAFKQEYNNSVEDKLSKAKWSIQESLQKDNQKKTPDKERQGDKNERDKIPQKRGRKSFKEMDAEADLTEVPDDEILFSKRYYPISVVAGWFRVNTSLLRFWENEFDILKPKKNGKGDRLFRPEDVKNLQLIHHLLRQKKYTLDGAKDFLKANKDTANTQFQLTQTLQNFKHFLLELKANLQS